jgi:hypothetical protein
VPLRLGAKAGAVVPSLALGIAACAASQRIESLHVRFLFLGILLLGAPGCGGSPASPADASVTGTWVGAINTSRGRENLTSAMVQSGATVAGTWSMVLESTNVGGQLSGTKTAAILSVTLTPLLQPAECSYTYDATLSSATVMSGRFATFNCTTTDAGTLTLTKQ